MGTSSSAYGLNHEWASIRTSTHTLLTR